MAELFSGAEGTALAHSLGAVVSGGDEGEAEVERRVLQKRKEPLGGGARDVGEQKRIREAIKNAKTLEEISALEQQLEGGVIPSVQR